MRVVPDSAVFHLRTQANAIGQILWRATVGATVYNDGPATIYMDQFCSTASSMNVVQVFRPPEDSTGNALSVTPGCAVAANVAFGPANARSLSNATAVARIAIPGGGSTHVQTDVESRTTAAATADALVTGAFQLSVDLRSSDGTKQGYGYNLLAPNAQRTTPSFRIALP